MTTSVDSSSHDGRRRAGRQRFLRWSLRGGGGLVVAIAAIGALHTSWGRPLLARLGGCPAMRVSASEVERVHRVGMLGQLAGDRLAPVRPALGFRLDNMSPADVAAWADAAHVTCTKKVRGLIALHCANVQRSVLPLGGPSLQGGAPVIEDLAFTFDSKSRLISVDAFTRGLRDNAATEVYASSRSALEASFGRPTDEVGSRAANALSLYASARRRYRYSDYVAIVSMTRLDTGLAFREQFLSGG